MYVNISDELFFSEVHEGMNRSGSQAKFTLHAIHCGSYLGEPQKKINSFLKYTVGNTVHLDLLK